MRLQGNIYLIGPMGAGKTTVGRRLARLLRREFIDTDHALEERTGVSVSHIFEIEGEAGFRKREARLLAEISGAGAAGNGGAVVATGGGIILREDNRRVMHKSGILVYLRASPELLRERLKDCQSRPLLSGPEPASTITRLLEERDPLYASAADFAVEARAEPAAAMAARIQTLLGQVCQGNENR